MPVVLRRSYRWTYPQWVRGSPLGPDGHFLLSGVRADDVGCVVLAILVGLLVLWAPTRVDGPLGDAIPRNEMSAAN